MKHFMYTSLLITFTACSISAHPTDTTRILDTARSQNETKDEINDLIELCRLIARVTNSPEVYLLEEAIEQSHSRAKIPMRALISMVRYAGITLKICEAQKDLPVYRIQQLAELLSSYWATVWERWQQRNVYPVNLEFLARSVETTHDTKTNSPSDS